jgi:hypothetical protein
MRADRKAQRLARLVWRRHESNAPSLHVVAVQVSFENIKIWKPAGFSHFIGSSVEKLL